MFTASNLVAAAGAQGAAAGPETVATALRGLLSAALRPIRYQVCYRAQVQALARLDPHMLRDIGVHVGDIDEIAHELAQARVARAGGLAAAAAGLVAALRRAAGSPGAPIGRVATS